MTWTFLVLEEHPYGREMLRQLLDAGFTPSVIVEENSRASGVEREKFLKRIEGQPLPPSFTEMLDGRDVKRRKVKNHNSDKCRRIVEKSKPNLIVLGGTRIVKPHIFGLAPDGCLNSHPGLLPEVRGSASVAWAVERDIPIGSTCHFITDGIDTGPIVGRRKIEVRRGDTYEKLCWETIRMAGTLMTEAVRAWTDGSLTSSPQPDGGTTHRNMPEEKVEAVRRKLIENRYAHYVE